MGTGRGAGGQWCRGGTRSARPSSHGGLDVGAGGRTRACAWLVRARRLCRSTALLQTPLLILPAPICNPPPTPKCYQVFFPYTMSAVLLADLGLDPYRIDAVVAGKFGMPMGPFRSAGERGVGGSEARR